jgi:hypothetical protein
MYDEEKVNCRMDMYGSKMEWRQTLLRFPKPIYDNIEHLAATINAPAGDLITFAFIWGFQRKLTGEIYEAFVNYRNNRKLWYAYAQGIGKGKNKLVRERAKPVRKETRRYEIDVPPCAICGRRHSRQGSC